MKTSALIALLQQRIKQYDDLEIVVYRQTGPDSWLMVPVKDVVLELKPRNRRVLEIQLE